MLADVCVRRALWRRRQKTYTTALPVIPLYFRANPHALPKWLNGIEPTGDDGQMMGKMRQLSDKISASHSLGLRGRHSGCPRISPAGSATRSERAGQSLRGKQRIHLNGRRRL